MKTPSVARRLSWKRYNDSPKGRERCSRYLRSVKGRVAKERYVKSVLGRFTESNRRRKA